MTQLTLNTSLNKVKKFISGKGVTVYADKDFDGPEKLDLDFEKLTDYNRMVNNFKKNKGFILKGSQMKEAIHNGGKINWGKIERGFKKFINNPVVKKVIKVAAPVLGKLAGQAAGAYMGNPAMGDLIGSTAGDAIGNAYGNGFIQNVPKQFMTGLKVVGRRGRPIAKKVLNFAKHEYEANKPAINNFIKGAIKDKIKEKGLDDRLANAVNKTTGINGLGEHATNYLNNGLDRALNVEGQGVGVIKKKRGRPRKVTGAEVKEAEQDMGLGGMRSNAQTMKERMAYVRSFRNKVGGSMISPL
jgi:hypothetical protein